METDLESLSFQKAKQPLVAVALFFAAGIVFQHTLPIPWNPFLLIAAGGVLIWMLVSWNRLSSPWPILPLVLVAGALLTAAQSEKLGGLSPYHLRQKVLRIPQHLILRGIVLTDPVHRVREQGGRQSFGSDDGKSDDAASVDSEFQLKVSAVKFHVAWEPVSGDVQVRLRSHTKGTEIPGRSGLDSKRDNQWILPSENRIEFGQEIEVEGVLEEPPVARNFGLFDYAAYLRQKGIHYTLQADGSDAIHVLGSALDGSWIFTVRQKLAERLTLGIENDSLAVGIIRGMLLGYREDIPSDVNEAFRRSGTLHVFAISGSHITLIALALLIALRQFRVPRNYVCFLILPILIFYVFATGLRASAIRSLVMAAVVIMGWWLERPSALLNNLAASALIILAWDPFQLFDPGFQLSFVVVASLILFVPVIDRKIRLWLEPDSYIPKICLPAWRLALIPPCRWLIALTAVCLAAWVGSFGLNLYYFNLVSLVAILANLLIVPLASVSVGLGLVSLLFGVVWDQLAITLNTSHALLVHAMVMISEGLAGLEYGYFYVTQPHAGWIVAGYVLFMVILLLWIKRRRAGALILATIFGVTVTSLIFAAWNTEKVRLDVLDVGSGQSVLITGPRFERVLIDAGNKSQGQMVIKPFLRSRGVNALDLVVLTHGDAAHYGGLLELLGSVPICQVVVADASFRSTGYKQLLAQIEKSGVSLKRWKMGDHEMLYSGQISVLWPPGDSKTKRADDQGLVMELRTKFGSCLFASDSGETVERAIVSSGLGSCSILIQGRHSNEESVVQSYLDALKVRMTVLNSAERPFSARFSSDVEERLQQMGVRVFQTNLSGGVRIDLGKNGIFSQSFLKKDNDNSFTKIIQP